MSNQVGIEKDIPTPVIPSTVNPPPAYQPMYNSGGPNMHPTQPPNTYPTQPAQNVNATIVVQPVVNQALFLGKHPTNVVCPSCKANVITRVNH
ncbi:unnamed protein product [Brachionus calyciflorus]|uniref:LITAF domain-containing protein n=1 Tax=Brachionus calyciflorus TaxID=104777 RepID=A0A814MW08_9BILA|nr:unnamed protein product [Brachionus calyciflorus]